MISNNIAIFSIFLGEGSEQIDIGTLVDGITAIDRGIGNTWNNNFTSRNGRYGKRHTYSYLDMKTITVDFVIKGDQQRMFKARRQLAQALDTFKGPVRLMFNDEPNQYYLALTDGKVPFRENIDKTEGRGTITFVVSDGIAHSTFSKVLRSGQEPNASGFIINNTEDGTVDIHINNRGSLEAYPTIKITNNEDNGYFGILNGSGVMELGYKDATIEGAIIDNGGIGSEKLLNITKGDNTATTGWGLFKNGSSIFPTSPVSSNVFTAGQGTLSSKTNTTGFTTNGFSYDGNGGTNLGYRWVGGISYYDLPADKSGLIGAANFKAEFNIKFWANRLGQTGYITVAFVDKDNKLIAGYDIAKEDKNGNTAEFRMWLEKDKTKESIKFQANNAEKNQKEPNLAYNQFAGASYVTKEGPVITFGYGNKAISLREPSLEFKKCTRIVITSGSFTDKNTTVGDVVKMVVESISFSKSNVKRLDQIPNRYVKDSQVLINLEEGIIEFIPDKTLPDAKYKIQEDLVHGSDFFSVPVGDDQIIKIHQSTFNKTFPDVEIEWYENYL